MVFITLFSEDPLKNTTVLKALHWVINAWRNGVITETISNCWCSSQLFGPVYEPIVRPADWDDKLEIQRLAESLAEAGCIKQVIDLQNFLNPLEEVIKDTGDDLITHVAEVFSEEAEEGDKDAPEE